MNSSSLDLTLQNFIYIDCQTTGIRPSNGHLLEIAWAFGNAANTELEIHSYLVKLPHGAWFPPKVQEITGLRERDLREAIDIDEVRTKFLDSLSRYGENLTALIHYSQFEEPFLRSFLNVEEGESLPFQILCTHKFAKKLFPATPSRNIRGLTGFFGERIGEIKRAAQHVRATHLIWKGIADALNARNLQDLSSALQFLSEKVVKKPGEKAVAYEYRVDRDKRLALPNKPGIYKMKGKDGEILYVGKATSLKDRVNSYFRGKKGRDPRKLEMMAQVWDLDVVECESAIEAALVESDEIKRLNPPYNVSLKNERRAMIFYSRDFSSESVEQVETHNIGPFRRFNSVELLRNFLTGIALGEVRNVFYRPIEEATLGAGFELFVIRHPEFNFDNLSVRDHLAFGLRLARKSPLTEADVEQAESEPELEILEDEEADYTPEDIADKFDELYLSAASSYLRSKLMTHLLWSNVHWTEKGEAKTLLVRSGQLVRGEALKDSKSVAPWSGLKIADFDRMSILLAEISRFPHEIETL